MSDYEYKVLLEVMVDGPEREWREVADALVGKVEKVRLGKNLTVSRVELDVPPDDPEDYSESVYP